MGVVTTLHLSAANAPAAPAIPLNLSSKELRAQIDRASEAVAQSLSHDAREAQRRSLARFYESVAALCGDSGQRGAPGKTVEACLRNEYYNYLAHVPETVYHVDGFTVYETGVYGLQWADDDLQQQDPERAFTWVLRVTWPRVDAPEDPSNPLWGPVRYALADQVHSRMSNWVTGLWELDVAVHVESLSRCYVSARIGSSWYAGGAHMNEGEDVFNWNRLAKRPLAEADLFRADSDWRGGILALYRRRLGEAAKGLSDHDMAPWVEHGYVITSTGLTIVGHEGLSRINPLPDVKLTWSELTPWISSTARCEPPSASQGP